jgi:hypothetical protein
LVESVEHGRELHRRLPDWDLATKAPMPPGVGTVVTKNVWRVRALEKVIMTYREAVSLDEIDPHVLICAGPEWPFELEGFPLRSQDPACQAVVIDIADDFDRTARAAVRRRFNKYSTRGWQSIGAPSWAVRDYGDAMAHRPRGRRGRITDHGDLAVVVDTVNKVSMAQAGGERPIKGSTACHKFDCTPLDLDPNSNT